jgi:hypothetical protein
MHRALVAKKQNNKPWWHVCLSSYAQVSAITCSIAVAVIVISLQVVNKESAPLTAMNISDTDIKLNTETYQIIEIHELAPTNEIIVSNTAAVRAYQESLMSKSLSSPAKTEERQIQYKRAKNMYSSRQADLVIHEQGYATIVQSNDGLSLLTCDQHLLKLTQELVDMLMSRKNEQSINFSKGQMLAIGFDRDGHIIDISQETSKTEC